MIDKNDGIAYPVAHLKKWKADHEKLVKECLEGKIGAYLGTQLDDEFKTCRKIVKFLEQRGALFMDLKYEVPLYVFDSAKEIRTFLTQIQSEIIPGSSLETIIDSINHACRYFMNTTNAQMNMQEMSYSLGAMRKIIGINLDKMEKNYKIKLTGPIRNILPQ
jgi:hypothetical protein